MRFMAIITVNNPSMSSADWIEHHTKMKNTLMRLQIANCSQR
jgi:hypothetical protein